MWQIVFTVNMSPCLLSSILHNQDKKKSPRSHPTGNLTCDKLSLQSTCHPVHFPQFCIIKMKRSHPEVFLLKFLHVTSCLYSQHVTLFALFNSVYSRWKEVTQKSSYWNFSMWQVVYTVNMPPSLLPLNPYNQDCVGSAWWLFTQVIVL